MENGTATPRVLKDCTVLGASGFPFSAGDQIAVAFNGNTINCKNCSHLAKFSLVELADLSIAGPGSVTKGGNFIGGGFGVEGALEGMAIAGVLNALTTSTKTHTLVTFVTNFGELHLHYGTMEPGTLRIYLSDVFVKLRRMDPHWLQARTQLLEAHIARDAISTDDAEACRSRLSNPPVWLDLEAEAATQRLKDEMDAEAAPQGVCPSCDKKIPLSSESCRFCNANFGQYSSWQVTPIS